MNNTQNNNTMANFLKDYLKINDGAYVKGDPRKRRHSIVGIGKIRGEVYYRLKDCISGNKAIYHHEAVYNWDDYR